MYKIFLFSLFAFSIACLPSGTVNAQSQFQRTIGGASNDVAYRIVRTTDGGYAVACYTNSFGAGNQDMYIVKLDASGTLQWTKTAGGTSNDGAWSIIQTTDGGYAAAGFTNSFGAGSYDMYIVKLDASGTLQWTKTVGGTSEDDAHSIIQTTDGGYAAAGSALGDINIVKLDASGTLQWSKTLGGTSSDIAYSIIQTTDGGYAAAGYTLSFGAGSYDMYIVKLNAGGTLQWSKTLGGASNDYNLSIIQTTDGGYAVAGLTYSFGAGSSDMYIVKLDGSGTLQWSKTLGGTNGDIAYSIIQTTDGGYAAAGQTLSFGAGNNDIYIVKLDAGGTLQWSKTAGGASDDHAYSIIQTTDGGYAAAGWTGSFGAGNGDMYIVKLDASGNTCGNSTSPTSTVTTPAPTATSPISTVTIFFSTVTTPAPTVSSGGTVTTICVIGIQPISNEVPARFTLHQNYPNPFNPATKIRFALPKSSFAKLVVYDILGRELETLVNEQLNTGTYEVDFDGSKYSSGVYYYKLIADEYTETKKMILLK